MKKSNGSAVKAIFMSGILSVTAVLVLGVPQAHAYCVYNNSQVYLEVHGEFCSRCLSTNISPDGKACCPGDESGCRGDTLITTSRPNTVYETGMHYVHCGAKVPAHGWVKIYGAGQFLRCEVYRQGGDQVWSGQMHDGKN